MSSGKVVRLSVNVAEDVAQALQELVGRHETSSTEEVRRAISLAKWVDDQHREGRKLLVEGEGGLFEVQFP